MPNWNAVQKMIPKKQTKMSATTENIQIGIMVEVPGKKWPVYPSPVKPNQTTKVVATGRIQQWQTIYLLLIIW